MSQRRKIFDEKTPYDKELPTFKRIGENIILDGIRNRPVSYTHLDVYKRQTFTQSTLFDAFASIIRSKEFEERLTQLGGYTFTDTGKMVEYLD